MKFNVILSDCPWEYRNKNTGGSLKSGASHVYGANNKYSTMSLNELKSIPIHSVVDKNAVLFLWVTTNMQEEAMELLKSWGFKYKTKIYWYKHTLGGKLGMGYWMRNTMEELWVCIKGKIKAFHSQKPNLRYEPAGRHSEKPEYFRDLIMELTPNCKYLELFARKKTKGWTCLGYEIDHKDIRESLNELSAT